MATRSHSAVAAEGGGLKREVSSFQHADGRTSLLLHIQGGGALAESMEMKNGFIHAIGQKELWPLLVSIGAAVLLCAYKVGRMSTFNPDTFWNKEHRMAEIQDKDRLTKEGKAFARHKAGKTVADKQDIPKITLLGFQPKMKGRDPRHE